MKGFRTVLYGLALVIIPPALTYLAGIDWTQYVSPNIAIAITGAITLGLRILTTTPIGKSN